MEIKINFENIQIVVNKTFKIVCTNDVDFREVNLGHIFYVVLKVKSSDL